nr:MAG TPA: hypothetical protein [Caudoviricetes sp.]
MFQFSFQPRFSPFQERLTNDVKSYSSVPECARATRTVGTGPSSPARLPPTVAQYSRTGQLAQKPEPGLGTNTPASMPRIA